MPWTMAASAARWFSSTRRQSLTVLEPPVGDVGRDLLHGVEAEVAAVGEDRGEQGADIPGVDPLLARLLEVDAEPEVVLDLDEQVGEPDRAAAGVQPAVKLGEAVRLRRVGLLGRVRLQPPPVVVERDLPVVSDTLQEPVERIRQTCPQLLDRRGGIDGEPGSRPERFADLLPPRGGQEERLEPAEVSSRRRWRGCRSGSLGARTCSLRSQARARASSEAVRSSRNASSSRNRASRSPAAASKARRRRYSPMRC